MLEQLCCVPIEMNGSACMQILGKHLCCVLIEINGPACRCLEQLCISHGFMEQCAYLNEALKWQSAIPFTSVFNFPLLCFAKACCTHCSYTYRRPCVQGLPSVAKASQVAHICHSPLQAQHPVSTRFLSFVCICYCLFTFKLIITFTDSIYYIMLL